MMQRSPCDLMYLLRKEGGVRLPLKAGGYAPATMVRRWTNHSTVGLSLRRNAR
jgi:hypothetical protein